MYWFEHLMFWWLFADWFYDRSVRPFVQIYLERKH